MPPNTLAEVGKLRDEFARLAKVAQRKHRYVLVLNVEPCQDAPAEQWREAIEKIREALVTR